MKYEINELVHFRSCLTFLIGHNTKGKSDLEINRFFGVKEIPKKINIFIAFQLNLSVISDLNLISQSSKGDIKGIKVNFTFKEDVNITGKYANKKIRLIGLVFKKKLIIKDVTLQELIIHKCSNKYLNISESDINTLSLTHWENKVEHIMLSGLSNLDQLKIHGYSPLGQINIVNLSDSGVNKAYYLFYGFSIDIFNFSSNTVLPIIHFREMLFKDLYLFDLNLGKSTFNNTGIEKLYLNGVSLNECVFNNTSFPSKLNNDNGNNTTTQLKDTYRQLKHVMEKNGNLTEANKFYELEMESELAALTTNFTIKKFFSLDYWMFESNSISRKIPLTFSKVLTNFGNNWIPSFIFLNIFVLFSTLLKSLYLDYQSTGLLINEKVFTSSNTNTTLKILTGLVVLILAYLIVRILSFILNKYPIAGFGILILILNFSYNKNILGEYTKLLINPFYGFRDLIVYSNNYTGIELLAFAGYKIMYGIILWHLIVALKRTTKR